MEEKILQYNCGNRTVLITVKDVGNGIVSYPSFKPLPSVTQESFLHPYFSAAGDASLLSNACPEEQLNGDLLKLMPDSLQGNVFENIQLKLSELLAWHMRKYGRLLDDDLSSYLDEMILVIRGVQKSLNNSPFPYPYLSDSEARGVYNSLFKAIKHVQLR